MSPLGLPLPPPPPRPYQSWSVNCGPPEVILGHNSDVLSMKAEKYIRYMRPLYMGCGID